MPISLEQIQHSFLEHYDKLFQTALNITGECDDAKDVIQDVFLKIWQKKENMDDQKLNGGYLYRSVVNASLNKLQKRKGNNQILSTATIAIASNGDAPDQVLYGKELEKEIDRAIELLPPKCKAIFVLSRFEGLKYREIADHLDVSPKTVENQMGIALKKLQNTLSPYMTKEFLAFTATVGMSTILTYLLSSVYLIFIGNF